MFLKQYLYLYLSRFCYSVGNTLIDIYGTVLLYNNGLSVSQIFLIYAFRFGLMGILTPFSIIVSSRLGIGLTSLIANLTRTAVAYIILFNTSDSIILMIILLAIPGAISNPLATTLSAYHVKTQHRGKYNSLRIICKMFGSAFASLIILFSMEENKQMLLFSVVMIFFILDSVFTYFVSFKPKKSENNAFSETIHYITKVRDPLKLIYALRTFHIAERLFIPLYLYLALENFTLFSSVITISLTIQTILLLFSGHFADKNIFKMNKWISILRIILTSIFIFTKNKITISINKIAFDSTEQIYDMTYISSTENIIKNSPKENCLLASVGEMCLCFSELVCFAIIAFIAYYNTSYAFIFMFTASIISTIVMNIKIQEKLKASLSFNQLNSKNADKESS